MVKLRESSKATTALAGHTDEKQKAEPEKTALQSSIATEENAAPQKKHGLGQALKNLFRKKKKEDRE